MLSALQILEKKATCAFLRDSLAIIKATVTTYWEHYSIWDIIDSYPESFSQIMSDSQAHAELQAISQQARFK